MGRILSSKRTTLAALAVFLAMVGLLPILVMLFKSVMVDGCLSLALYRGLLTSNREWTLLGHSFMLASLTTLLAMIVGLPLGIFLAKTDLYLRRLFAVLFTIPLLVPPYINAVSWFGILGREGIVAQVLGPTLSHGTSAWLFGLGGCVLVLFSAFMPIVMLLTMTCLKTISPRLEEAGRLVSRWPLVLAGITVPLILPGILLAALLVFLLAIGEFGVPAFLRYTVFAVKSFTQFSAFYNFGAATAAAAPLAVITLLALLVERAFLRERTYQLRPAPHGEETEVINLGACRAWLTAVVGVFCFITVVLPLGVLISQSSSIRAYVEAISRAGDSLLRSVGFSLVGATVLTIIGFLTGYLIHTRAFKCWRGVDSLTLFLFALPSTVIGIGMVSLWNRPLTNFVYATPIIIVLGYVAQCTALSSRITVSTLAQIPPTMEEAAQIVGAGWFRRLAFIVAPLAGRGLVAAWLVGYIFCLRDTGITMIVYPPGQDTLPVRIFTLMANSPPGFIAALCVMMIAATLLPLAGLAWVFKRAQNPG